MESEATGYVRSLARGLLVIRAFDESHPQRTLSAVARASGLSRAVARRLLHTLVQLGYVATDGRVFRLTPRVLELGYAYLSSMSLPTLAEPHLERLVSETHESASVSVLDGDDIVYVARVPTARIMTVAITLGTRFPAYATSMGRAILAHLPESEVDEYLARVRLEPLGPKTLRTVDELRRQLRKIQAAGWALVDQELEAGLRSVAAPIRDHSGRAVAAVNLSTHASRTTLKDARLTLLPALRKTAERIEADLRGAMRSGALSR